MVLYRSIRYTDSEIREEELVERTVAYVIGFLKQHHSNIISKFSESTSASHPENIASAKQSERKGRRISFNSAEKEDSQYIESKVNEVISHLCDTLDERISELETFHSWSVSYLTEKAEETKLEMKKIHDDWEEKREKLEEQEEASDVYSLIAEEMYSKGKKRQR